ncbi:MAG: hypothetical protein LBG11_03920, partial [Bifidobacteriaceae bacterium]|nr:hypothetical protein [Bifidobacteriaceae bacterium]
MGSRRLRTALNGKKTPARRLKAVQRLSDPAQLAQVAATARDPAARDAAVARIRGQAVLADVAARLSRSVPGWRRTAVMVADRLEDRDK